jgi:hypothetical protein
MILLVFIIQRIEDIIDYKYRSNNILYIAKDILR